MNPNPFAALSLIVAPAILTNASSVLAMSTSNRLARAVDRARDLSRQLEAAPPGALRERLLRDLSLTEDRAQMLVRVLRSLYVGLAGFALAALTSLLGATMVGVGSGAGASASQLVNALEWTAIAAGACGVAGLIHGCQLLVRETRLALQVLQERAAAARDAR